MSDQPHTGRFLLIGLAAATALALWAPAVVAAPRPPDPTVEASNERGITLSWTPPPYALTVLETGDETEADQLYSQLQIPGTVPSGEPGQPQLPAYTTLIGLPESGSASLQIIAVSRERVNLPHPPVPAPVPEPVQAASTGLDAPPIGGPTALTPNPTTYATDAFYPRAIATLGRPAQIRDQRIARLTLHPLRVNPVTGEMDVIRHLRLKITFEHPAPSASTLNQIVEELNAFSRVLEGSMLNPEATRWRVNPAPKPPGEFSSATASAPSVKVLVEQAGLFALTYDDLSAAGLPVDTLDPRTLRLHHGQPRREVAIWLEGEGDGAFDPGDRLLFYADPIFSRFAVHDVYFLDYGRANGLRMENWSASPDGLPGGQAWHTVLAERDRYYEPHYDDHRGDYWYWDDLRLPDRTSVSYTVTLDPPPASGPDATLTLWLQGYTDPPPSPDHRVAVAVNGTPISQQTWDGKKSVEASFSVGSDGLQSGENQVELSLPGLEDVSVEGTWLDAFSVTYPIAQGGARQVAFQGEEETKAYTLTGWRTDKLHAFDVTDPDHPHRLTAYDVTSSGGTYTLRLGETGETTSQYLVAPEDQIKSPQELKPVKTIDPPEGADYVLITHPDFADAVAPLAAHRASQGLHVVTIEVEAIYDTYGAGRTDPAVIKAFLQQAYDTWTPRPTYVLLVGDGTYDFKGHSGHDAQTFIPPYMAPVDPWWGETAADNRFVTVVGDDRLPDMLIGRLPVTSPDEATTVVDKLLHYETDPPLGEWNAHHLFVADDPDSGGDFHAEAELAYTQVTSPFIGSRFYYGAGGSAHIYTDPDELRSDFLSRFDRGAGMITFNGHSSWHQWAVESFLRWDRDSAINDVTSLRNRYRLPVVLGMTCFTGFFHHPAYPTMDESLLRHADGGAIAVWGSTGLGVATGHRALQTGFYRTVMDEGEMNLGSATLVGKTKLHADGIHLDLLDTFTLFGDPAMAINLTIVPYSHHLYLPVVSR